MNIIYFYGHSPTKNGYNVFSNFYPASFVEDGVKFKSNEQYMMYHKAITFKDKETAKLILESKTPHECKKLGRSVKNYNDDVWSEIRYSIVRNGAMLKFSQNKHLGDVLLSTGDSILAEASLYDNIWGIGLNKLGAEKVGMSGWNGQNLLGKVLMEVRLKLLQERKS